MKLKFTFLVFCLTFLIAAVNGQTEKILEPGAGFLDDLIVGDTAADGSRVETVYILRRDAEYLVQGPFENVGWKLHMEAEEGTGKKPHVMPYPQEDGTINGDMMRLSGHGEFKNIFFDGRPQDQTQNACGRIWRTNAEGIQLDIEGCVLANCSQNGIMIPKAADWVKVNNTHFFNMGIIAQSDFGNGRVFDCRDSEINLFSLTNSTFVNSIDRIVRHRGGSGVMKEVIVDHCTMYNSASYHGYMEFGNIGESVTVTNNLMLDCMGLGADQSDQTRLSELDAHGETDDAGNPKMVWIGSIPNDSTTFTIHNNVYSVSDELQAFYTAQGVDEGPIFTDHIAGKLSDPDNAFVKKSISFPEVPPTMTNFYEWYYSPDGANKQKMTTQAVNYDMKSWAYWTDSLDCQYSATDEAFMGSDDVPVGDPNWGSTVTTTSRVEKIIEPGAGFLDDLIVGDTAADGSRVETVYILRRDAEYLVQGPFENVGWKLHMEAEEGTGKKPHVMPYPQEDGTINGDMMRLSGHGEFKNIFFDGRPQDQTQNACGRIWRTNAEGIQLDIEGCVLANCSQNGIMIPKAADWVKVNNTHFFNMGIIAQSDFGNGRVFDCRDSEINLFSLTNSTFVNSIDRIVRHRGGSGVMKEVIVDHCTMYNSASYHGYMEFGNIGESVTVTNNLMLDCMGLGADQSDQTRLSELDAHGETDDAGNPKMVWIGSIPNDSTTFTIHNNVYSVSDELQAFYTAQGVDEGPIFTDHIAGKLSDPDNAFVKKSISFPEVPPTMTNFYEWYYSPDGANKQKMTTQAVNYDMKSWAYWTDSLDCQYSATDEAFMGSDDIPVGDPNWNSTVEVTNADFYSLNELGMKIYPNPFSNSAKIQFNLDDYSRVSISIYEITGRLTRQIDAGSFAPGLNTYEIHKGDMQNGMYILRLDAGKKGGFTKIMVN